MKSKRSFCNGAIFRATLRRFWPLWCVYPILLYALLPAQFREYAWPEPIQILADGRLLLNIWDYLVLAAAGMGVVTAMCVFGHLYSPRQTALMASLPVTREAQYVSCFLAGLVPTLCADALMFGVCVLAEAQRGILNLPILLLTFGLLVLMNLTFYGFAALCAMLTGSAIVLPLVFLVLELVEAVVADMVCNILSALLFGYAENALSGWLSPLLWLSRNQPGAFYRAENRFEVFPEVIAILGVYAAAGLVFAAVGFFLYKRRPMETTGDVVAVKALRPVFRWCMALGLGLIFAWVYCRARIGSFYYNFYAGGLSAAVPAAVCAVLGCVIGWFGAEMLMRKTTRVFHWDRKQAGVLVAAAVLVLGLVGVGADVTGYASRLPAEDAIAAVQLATNGSGYRTDDRGAIAQVRELHRLLIEGSADYAAANAQIAESCTVDIFYRQTDGGLLHRTYRVYDPSFYPAMEDEIDALEAAMNNDEAFRQRDLTLPITPETLVECRVFYTNPSSADEADDGTPRAEGVLSRSLDAEQAASLCEAVRADLRDHTIGQFILFRDLSDIYTNLSVSFMLSEDDPSEWEGLGEAAAVDHIFYSVTTDSENTLAWLSEHLGLEP